MHSDDSFTAPPRSPRGFRVTTGETAHEPEVRPWELELLISGAVTFALVQVPPHLDAWFDGILPRLDRSSMMVAILLYYYGKSILYVLIGGFGLHLAARAYWVGLIGLEAVFPNGIRWETTRYGPILRDVYGRRLGSLQPLIDRADRICSVIFPAAFSLVMLFLYSVVVVGIAAGAAALLARVLGVGSTAVFYFGVLTCFMLVSTGTTLIDRRWGERWPEGTRGHRVLRGVATAMYYGSGMPLFGAVWMILFSNIPKKLFFGVMYLVFGGVLALVMVKDILAGQGDLMLDDYALLPVAGARVVSPSYYESQWRREDGPVDVPSIQSDVVTGPYVRLFIPYVPRWHNPVMRERCPDLAGSERTVRMRPEAGDTLSLAEQDAVLRCWTRLQPVTLNGAPIEPRFRFYRHPTSDVRGIVAYLPTAQLVRGENLLTVAGVPRTADSERPPRTSYVIPFYR